MRTCQQCGKKFQQSQKVTKNKPAKFCSRECGHAAQVIDRVEGECKNCGATLTFLPSRPLLYCDDACMREDKGWTKQQGEYTPHPNPKLQRAIAEASQKLIEGDTRYQQVHQKLCRMMLQY